MQIKMAHLRDQGISFAVFAADATSHTDRERSEVLIDLTMRARAAGLRVDKAALAYEQNGRTMFYGVPDLVRYLQVAGVPRWTHTLDT